MRSRRKLTLGVSTFDWYSAWNCVPFNKSAEREHRFRQDSTLTNKVRVILELKDLHTLTSLVFSNKVQTGGIQALDICGVNLVSVTVSLLNLVESAVEGADLGPLAARLEDGLSRSEAHGTSHVLLVELRHGDDDAVAGGGVELLGVGAWQVANVAGELNGGGLKSEANLQS